MIKIITYESFTLVLREPSLLWLMKHTRHLL